MMPRPLAEFSPPIAYPYQFLDIDSHPSLLIAGSYQPVIACNITYVMSNAADSRLLSIPFPV